MSKSTKKQIKFNQILCVGDDLMEALSDDLGLGWFYPFQRKFEKPPYFLNLGFGGDNTAETFEKMQREVWIRNPESICLSTGTIDCVKDNSSKEQIISVWEDKMLPFLLKAKEKEVYVILFTIPLYNIHKPHEEFGTVLEKIKWHNQYIKSMANDNAFLLVDLENIWPENQASTYLLNDNYRLTSQGYNLLADQVYKDLSPYLGV